MLLILNCKVVLETQTQLMNMVCWKTNTEESDIVIPEMQWIAAYSLLTSS